MAVAFGVAALYATTSNMLVNAFAATAIGSSRQFEEVGQTIFSTTEFGTGATFSSASTTTTALCMGRGGGVRARGLEQRREGPTPTGTYEKNQIPAFRLYLGKEKHPNGKAIVKLMVPNGLDEIPPFSVHFVGQACLGCTYF